MEIKNNQEGENNFDSDDQELPTEEIEENIETNEPESPDFGPPRRHTVIGAAVPIESKISEEPQQMLPFLRKFPPPPPRFSRAGRVGIIRGINAEAELVNPEEDREHHTVMMS